MISRSRSAVRHPTWRDENHVNAVLEIQLQPFGFPAPVREVLALNRHAINKCSIHYRYKLVYGRNNTKNRAGTQICGPHTCVYQLFLILLRSCGTYATFLMHSGFAVARLVAAAFLDEETLGDEAGEEVGEAVLVSS